MLPCLLHHAQTGPNQPRERQRRDSGHRYPMMICLRVPHSPAQAHQVQVRKSWAGAPVNPERVHRSTGEGVRKETDRRTGVLSFGKESHLEKKATSKQISGEPMRDLSLHCLHFSAQSVRVHYSVYSTLHGYTHVIQAIAVV
jgi:hypothetical protein